MLRSHLLLCILVLGRDKKYRWHIEGHTLEMEDGELSELYAIDFYPSPDTLKSFIEFKKYIYYWAPPLYKWIKSSFLNEVFFDC